MVLHALCAIRDNFRRVGPSARKRALFGPDERSSRDPARSRRSHRIEAAICVMRSLVSRNAAAITPGTPIDAAAALSLTFVLDQSAPDRDSYALLQFLGILGGRHRRKFRWLPRGSLNFDKFPAQVAEAPVLTLKGGTEFRAHQAKQSPDLLNALASFMDGRVPFPAILVAELSGGRFDLLESDPSDGFGNGLSRVQTVCHSFPPPGPAARLASSSSGAAKSPRLRVYYLIHEQSD